MESADTARDGVRVALMRAHGLTATEAAADVATGNEHEASDNVRLFLSLTGAEAAERAQCGVPLRRLQQCSYCDSAGSEVGPTGPEQVALGDSGDPWPDPRVSRLGRR